MAIIEERTSGRDDVRGRRETLMHREVMKLLKRAERHRSDGGCDEITTTTRTY
jgi:hypothetical protein